MTNLYLKDKVTPPGSTAWTGSDNNIIYQTGRTVMTLNTGSIWSWLVGNDPGLAANTTIVPTPAGPEGSFTWAMPQVLTAFKKTENPELVKDMLEYFFLNIETLYVDGGKELIPPLQNILHNRMWQGHPGRVFVENALGATPTGYPGPIGAAPGQVLSEQIISDMLGKVILQGMSVGDAVTEAAEKMKVVFASYYPEG